MICGLCRLVRVSKLRHLKKTPERKKTEVSIRSVFPELPYRYAVILINHPSCNLNTIAWV